MMLSAFEIYVRRKYNRPQRTTWRKDRDDCDDASLSEEEDRRFYYTDIIIDRGVCHLKLNKSEPPNDRASAYNGVALPPGQRTNLQLFTALLAGDIVDSGTAHDTSISSAAPRTRATSLSVCGNHMVSSKFSSSDSSANESGFIIKIPSQDTTFELAHQTKTFDQLCVEHGVRNISHAVFDNRWQLQVEESHFVTGIVHRDQGHDTSRPDGHSKSIRRPDPLEQDSALLRSSIGCVPVPPEIERLETLVRNISDGRCAYPWPYNPVLIRRLIFSCCFGHDHDPTPLSHAEGECATMHNGRLVTLLALRRELLVHIEEVVAYLMDDIAYKVSAFYGQDIQIGHTDTKRLVWPLYHKEYDSMQNSPPKIGNLTRCIPSSMAEEAPGSLPEENPYAVKHDQSQNVGSDRLGNVIDKPPHQVQLQEIVSYANSITATPSSLYSTPYGTWTSLVSSSNSTPLQSPEHVRRITGRILKQGITNPHFLISSNQAPQFNRAVLSKGLQNCSNTHTMVPHGGQTITDQTSFGFGTSGAWIPSDRSVRPPASNRIAPLFAQTSAWQIPAPRPAAPEWANKSIAQIPAVACDTRKLAYLEGSDEMCVRPGPNGLLSLRYQELVQFGHMASVTTKDENMPFGETARVSRPAEWGVLKIGNIPYDISRSAIVAFLGNHAKIITPELGPAIHIIMDRATGKTQDCFVEFFSTPDAKAWVNVIIARHDNANRIGDRVLDAQLSSQDELIRALFPKAKNIAWSLGRPSVIPTDEEFNSGFKSFISAEELQALAKHAEQPRRSNYTLKCPNRPYEAMISLLTKFPWHACHLYSLATRNKIFEAARQMLHLLTSSLQRQINGQPSRTNDTNKSTKALTSHSAISSFRSQQATRNSAARPSQLQLLKELLSASLNAAGFSERQRWELWKTAGLVNSSFILSPLAEHWPFTVVGRKRAFEENIVEWYANLISRQTTAPSSSHPEPFGNLLGLLVEIREDMTMLEAGQFEWKVLKEVLEHQCQV